jgi:diaminohydroxyphosphoribosylaminopyrimidine deaminase / 5-amino-6-(5-phosphoribosylamino)uracil reductase
MSSPSAISSGVSACNFGLGARVQPAIEAGSNGGADAHFMRLALKLGGRGSPAPNPHVGAVLVHKGRVVGEGFHERAGGPHAEASAIANAGDAARGATLYVTLEPCNHHGRTPPCVDGILRAGIRRVVIGCPDPNPFVSGGGAARLAEAGLDIVWGNWLADAEALIADWRRALDVPCADCEKAGH